MSSVSLTCCHGTMACSEKLVFGADATGLCNLKFHVLGSHPLVANHHLCVVACGMRSSSSELRINTGQIGDWRSARKQHHAEILQTMGSNMFLLPIETNKEKRAGEIVHYLRCTLASELMLNGTEKNWFTTQMRYPGALKTMLATVSHTTWTNSGDRGQTLQDNIFRRSREGTRAWMLCKRFTATGLVDSKGKSRMFPVKLSGSIAHMYFDIGNAGKPLCWRWVVSWLIEISYVWSCVDMGFEGQYIRQLWMSEALWLRTTMNIKTFCLRCAIEWWDSSFGAGYKDIQICCPFWTSA